MIGFLRGLVAFKSDDHLVLDVQGVGYIVYCSERTLAQIAPGQSAQLFTDLLVRQDILQLYGFTSMVEKEWYRLLTSVQGVGSKAALSILGSLGADGVSRAIALSDTAAVKSARGIGPKTAQRVVNELKDKAPAVMALAGQMPQALPEMPSENASAPSSAPATSVTIEAAPKAAPAHQAAQSEALSALTNLGYAPSEAAQAVVEAANADPDMETGALIKAALRLMAPKG